jgi:hypothetical protein
MLLLCLIFCCATASHLAAHGVPVMGPKTVPPAAARPRLVLCLIPRYGYTAAHLAAHVVPVFELKQCRLLQLLLELDLCCA